MKAGSGKSKGSAFEREVCRRLSLWLSQGERDDLLWRSAMSGGRATVQFRRGKVNVTQSGDVSAVGQGAFEFCERTFVEAKFYRDLQIGRGIVCGTGSLIKFWDKAVEEASKYSKVPMLVARQNLYPTLAVTKILDGTLMFSGCSPMIILPNWGAHVYLFDEVTRVTAPMRRNT